MNGMIVVLTLIPVITACVSWARTRRTESEETMRIAQITWLLPLIVGIVFTGSLLAQNSSVPQSSDQHQTTNQPAQTSVPFSAEGSTRAR